MIYTFQGFRLDPGGRRLVSADGEPIPLTSRVFDTLLYLVSHRGELLDKDSLMQAVWPDTVVEENRLNQVISALRKALGEKPGEQRFILTEPGRGYRFVAEVQELDQEPGPVQAEAATPTLSGHGMRLYIGLLILAALAGFAYLYLNYPEHVQKQEMTSTAPAANPEQVVKVTPPPSVAVLPFADMSPDKDQEYFADGVADEVLNKLSRIRDLFVIGRESSFTFKGKNEDLRVIGEKLGVAYLLEGSVRKEGKRVVVTTQLVKAEDGRILWSKSYDQNLEEFLDIEVDIARSVADALQITLGVGELGKTPGMTRNIAAYDAYLKGFFMYKTLRQGNISSCIEQLEKATDLDPNFARAWNVLSGAYLHAAYDYFPERADEYLSKFESATRTAVAIAPGSMDAYFADQRLQASRQNWSVWDADVTNLIKLVPFNGHANAVFGAFLVATGRPHEAVEYLQRATRSEPLVLGYALALTTAYDYIGNFKAGLKELERSKGLEGDHIVYLVEMAMISMETGDRDRLDTVLEKWVNYDLLPADNRSLTGIMRSLLDSPDQAHAELYRLYKDPDYNNFGTHIALAHWASYFHEPRLALTIFTELSGSRPFPFDVLWRPLNKDMRTLPGFKDLVTQLGFVDYWRSTNNWNEFCHPLGEDDFECH